MLTGSEQDFLDNSIFAKNLKNVRRVGIYFLIVGLLFGCSDNGPELSKEKVEFNSVTINLVPDGLQSTIPLEYKDLDGDGNAEVISQAVLKPNTTYNATVRLYQETTSAGREDVTDELLFNFSAYTFCYDPGAIDMLITRTDDSSGDVLGLTSTWITTDASEGSVLFTISYQPVLADANCGVGEKQLEVAFPINVRTGNSPN